MAKSHELSAEAAMRLVIVGNGSDPGGVARDNSADWGRVAAFIDSADFVVRFNAMPNQTQAWTGRRVDRLYLRGQGSPGRYFGRFGVPLLAVDPPSQLVMAVDLRPYPRPNHDEHEMTDFTASIAARHRFAHTVRLEQEVIAAAQAMVQAERNPLMPSLGFVALVHLLGEHAFTRHERFLLGFNHEGWEGHPWGVEQRLTERWLVDANLRRFP